MPNTNLESDSVEMITLVSTALEKAAQAYQTKEAADQEIAQLIPSVVNELEASGLIDTEDRDLTAQSLTNHKQAVALLKFAAEAYKSAHPVTALPAKEVDINGRTVTKQASAVQRESSYDRASREADRVLGIA